MSYLTSQPKYLEGQPDKVSNPLMDAWKKDFMAQLAVQAHLRTEGYQDFVTLENAQHVGIGVLAWLDIHKRYSGLVSDFKYYTSERSGAYAVIGFKNGPTSELHSSELKKGFLRLRDSFVLLADSGTAAEKMGVNLPLHYVVAKDAVPVLSPA